MARRAVGANAGQSLRWHLRSSCRLSSPTGKASSSRVLPTSNQTQEARLCEVTTNTIPRHGTPQHFKLGSFTCGAPGRPGREAAGQACACLNSQCPLDSSRQGLFPPALSPESSPSPFPAHTLAPPRSLAETPPFQAASVTPKRPSLRHALTAPSLLTHAQREDRGDRPPWLAGATTTLSTGLLSTCC